MALPVEAKQGIDPMVAELAASIGMVLDPAGFGAEAGATAGSISPASKTVTDIITEQKQAQATAGDAAKGGEKPPGETKSGTETPPPEKKEGQGQGEGQGGAAAGGQPPAAPAADQGAGGKAADGGATDGVISPEIIDGGAEAARVAAAPAPAAPSSADQADAERVAGLSEEEREEYELARYAEGAMPDKHKGKAKATLEYFTKVAEWTKANPDADEDDLKEFIATIKPAWDSGERRRLEIRKATEETETRVRAEMDERIRQSEVKPVVQKQVDAFKDKLLVQKLPDGMDQLNPAVQVDVKAFLERPSKEAYEDLREKHPLEAPTLVETALNAEAFLRVMNGLDGFNEKNPRHTWLATFVAKQGEILERAPEEKRIRNGRQFLSRHKLMALAQQNPAEASKYYTFEDREILDMLAVNAAMAITQKYKKSGLVRPGQVAAPAKPATPPTPEPPPPAANPPKAGATIAPGAGVAAKPADPEIARFFTALGPGVKEMMEQATKT